MGDIVKSLMLVVADPGALAPPAVYCGGATATILKMRSAHLGALLDPLVAEVAER